MKNLSLFVSAFALCASTSFAAIDCSTLPSCDSLGYKDKVAECPSSSEVLKCPFDTTWGKCTRGPSIGDLKYSLKSSDHDGWLLCDGRFFESDSTSKYHELFQLIGTNFCHKFTSKDEGQTSSIALSSSCPSGKFAIPDYRGFFLRAMPSWREVADGVDAPKSSPASSGGHFGYAVQYMSGNLENYSQFIPRKEQLPNLSGDLAGVLTMNNNVTAKTGVFKNSAIPAAAKNGTDNRNLWWNENSTINFNANEANKIYQEGGHVIPAHYAAFVFIYAGR